MADSPKAADLEAVSIMEGVCGTGVFGTGFLVGKYRMQMDPCSVTIEDHVFVLLEVCEVVVVSHVLPSGSLVTVVVDEYEVLPFFATSGKTFENFVLGIEAWAWNWNSLRKTKLLLRLVEVTFSSRRM